MGKEAVGQTGVTDMKEVRKMWGDQTVLCRCVELLKNKFSLKKKGLCKSVTLGSDG